MIQKYSRSAQPYLKKKQNAKRAEHDKHGKQTRKGKYGKYGKHTRKGKYGRIIK